MNPHRKHLLVVSFLIWLLLGAAQSGAQVEAPYLNPELTLEQRVDDLLARMTLGEKIGQMTLVEKNSISPAEVTDFVIGGVLSGGGGYPQPNTPEAWAAMVDAFQDGALATRLAIPMIYGVDAVHGHNNVRGATIFPHEVGLGATRDAELVEQIGRAVAQEMIATGIYWNYAPVVAVPQDIRWGRAYEAYGENTELVSMLAEAYIRGLQTGELGGSGSVLATPKHYVGDGGAVWGTSPVSPQNVDRGITHAGETTLRAVHLPPYETAIAADAQSIMISFSSWGGLNMHAQKYLIADVLKEELGFSGFIVSDWAGVDLVSPNYYEAVVTSINAGVDMVMVPQDFRLFMLMAAVAVERGDISAERIDDAVRRILRVKFALGLFEHPMSDARLLATVGSEAHRALARRAVAESLVLLKNEGQTLPIASDTQTIYVSGSAADDIGRQSGGWTIEWQGSPGDITPGTTILEAVRDAAGSGVVVEYEAGARFDTDRLADVGIAVVGELPYAEWQGDSATLSLTASDLAVIHRLRDVSKKLVVVLISGRPLIIDDALDTTDAFIAAWLPGTEGAGVADGLFGDQPFVGRLAYTWPRSIEQIPFDFAASTTEGCDAPLFPYGYSLDSENASSPYLDLAEACHVSEISTTLLPERKLARRGAQANQT